MTTPQLSELGKRSEYASEYNPDKLFPIPRKEKRNEIGVYDVLPFYGFDVWNHYEVSWLNQKGKPIVAMAEISYPCESTNIIESKSLKLYFNSFNNSKFNNAEEVALHVRRDLEERVGAPVIVNVIPFPLTTAISMTPHFEGVCIDTLDVECTAYQVDPRFLSTTDEVVEETLYSDLLKSNCLVTNQPDWGSVQIVYKGKKIQQEGLLRYLVSFRNHNEFHEQCIERIFVDIMRICAPEELTVYGRYTRRGGLDINPYRSTKPVNQIKNLRLCRQ